MNILIKLMSIVSLVIAPYIAVVATNSEDAALKQHCIENGVCPESGKACTWDEAKQMCVDVDGKTCSKMPEATKACCKMDGAELS